MGPGQIVQRAAEAIGVFEIPSTLLKAAMPLHDCKHAFETLASVVLPDYLAQIQRLLITPRSMSAYRMPGVGPRSLLKDFGLPVDFLGCCVLSEGQTPAYVSIFRNVIGRLRLLTIAQN